MESHQDILKQAQEKILAALTPESLKEIERAYLGKKGAVASLLASIPTLPKDERRRIRINVRMKSPVPSDSSLLTELLFPGSFFRAMNGALS